MKKYFFILSFLIAVLGITATTIEAKASDTITTIDTEKTFDSAKEAF